MTTAKKVIIILAIALGVIIAALIVDRTYPDKGVFWRTMQDIFNIKRGIHT